VTNWLKKFRSATTQMSATNSVATVRFGSVQTLILPNLELNLRFSSGVCLNLELNLPELVQEVRFRFSGGSNPELNLKKL
jgi:hypothetical protein